MSEVKLHETNEGIKMQKLVSDFCTKWVGCKKAALVEFEDATVELIGEIQNQMIIGTIRTGSCGKNLYSEVESINQKLNELSMEVKGITNKANSTKSESSTVKPTKEPQNGGISPKKKSTKSKDSPFATQKAEEFYNEHLSFMNVEDIEGTSKSADAPNKITVPDLKKALKAHNEATSATSKDKKTKKSKVENTPKKICKGTTAKNEPCKMNGIVAIKGEWYCAKHQHDFKPVLPKDTLPEVEDNDQIIENIKKFREASASSSASLSKDDEKLNTLVSNKSDNEEEQEEQEEITVYQKVNDIEGLEKEEYDEDYEEEYE